jgi:hypothetical protein
MTLHHYTTSLHGTDASSMVEAPPCCPITNTSDTADEEDEPSEPAEGMDCNMSNVLILDRIGT